MARNEGMRMSEAEVQKLHSIPSIPEGFSPVEYLGA
jgi:hypothetical protein